MTVAIVTDTTSCLPPELAERYSIEVVPVNIIFGGRTFNDSMRTDTSEFYDLLRRSNEKPTTAAPSPGAFAAAIRRAASGADAVLCITVSAQFSAMYDSARQAIELVRAETPALDVRLLDSRNAAMAQGFTVLEAARSAAGGATIDAVAARAEEMTGRVTLLAMLDTLTFLARSGRVPRVAAWAAGMLQVRPIVRFDPSGIHLAGRTRTREKALEKLLSILTEITAGRRTHLAVHHAGASGDGERLAAEAGRRIDLAECWVTEFTQVMGVHTGPGLVGLAFWCE